MVSQTWDDHDRSGRYAARDFGMNYLSSVDENGIIFTNGDNDTFPLWYAQEVEGWRTDVRVVNLSYLSTDWYINQMRRPYYKSAALPMLAPKDAYSYDHRQFNYLIKPDTTMMIPVEKALRDFYDDSKYAKNEYGLPEFKYPFMYEKINKEAVIKNGIVSPDQASAIEDYMDFNITKDPDVTANGGLSSSEVMEIDIISSIIRQGWKRPIYFAMTVTDNYYAGLMDYLASTGMAYQIMPIKYGWDGSNYQVNTDKAYRNVTQRFRWGGLDKCTPEKYPYLDETVRRMVTTTRSTMTDLAFNLLIEGMQAKSLMTDSIGGTKLAKGSADYVAAEKLMNDRFNKARNIVNLIETKLPSYTSPYAIQMGERIAKILYALGNETGNKNDIARANKIIESELIRYGQYARFYQSLSPSQYRLLSNSDMYVDTYYIMDLLHTYNENNPNQTEQMLRKLEAQGVDVQRIFARYPKDDQQ